MKDVPGNRKIIEELKLARGDKPGWMQSLSVHAMEPIKKSQKFFIGTADINFDGHDDLYLVTNRGVANSYADYWVFNPVKQIFDYKGNFPMLSIDTKKHLISSYERGGDGGMIYESKKYEFINGKLEVTEIEKQITNKKYGIYQKQILQRKDGKLVLVNSETVRAKD